MMFLEISMLVMAIILNNVVTFTKELSSASVQHVSDTYFKGNQLRYMSLQRHLSCPKLAFFSIPGVEVWLPLWWDKKRAVGAYTQKSTPRVW